MIAGDCDELFSSGLLRESSVSEPLPIRIPGAEAPNKFRRAKTKRSWTKARKRFDQEAVSNKSPKALSSLP